MWHSRVCFCFTGRKTSKSCLFHQNVAPWQKNIHQHILFVKGKKKTSEISFFSGGAFAGLGHSPVFFQVISEELLVFLVHKHLWKWTAGTPKINRFNLQKDNAFTWNNHEGLVQMILHDCVPCKVKNAKPPSTFGFQPPNIFLGLHIDKNHRLISFKRCYRWCSVGCRWCSPLDIFRCLKFANLSTAGYQSTDQQIAI